MTNKFMPPEAKGEAADNTGKVLRPAIIKSAVALVLLIAAILTYVFLPDDIKTLPILEPEQKKILLIDGEAEAGTSSLRMFELISSEDLKSIQVTNKNGADYTLNKASEGGFYFNDNKNSVYTSDAFTFLFSATCNTVTNERVYPDLYTGETRDIIPYDSFGLGDNYNGRYTVTTSDDKKYTVRIGNMAPNGDGYYACVEGREAVYIMASDVGDTVLGTLESVVTPSLGIQNATDSSQTSTAIDHVTFWKNGKHVATVNSVSQDEIKLVNTISNFVMACSQSITPEDLLGCANITELEKLIGINAMSYDYVPDDMTYNDIASVLPSLNGEETVALKDDKTGTITDEQLEKYGIVRNAPAHEIFYSYTDAENNVSYNHIILSEKTADGYYYAYSNLNSVIVKVPEDTLYYLEWDYDRLVESSYFQQFITSFKEISVKSDNVDYTFKLSHTVTTEGGGAILVYQDDKSINAENFRRFYRVLLSRKLRGAYEGEVPAEDTLFLTVTLTDMDDNVSVYKYYRASTQQAYMTINGKGEFYCLNSDILKIERDATKLVNGEEVLNEDWY